VSASTSARQFDFQGTTDMLYFSARNHANMSHMPIACIFKQIQIHLTVAQVMKQMGISVLNQLCLGCHLNQLSVLLILERIDSNEWQVE
jgi:hypothetical protein